MLQRRRPELASLKIGVGDLIGHADRERDISEIDVGRRFGLVKTDSPDPALGAGVIQPGIAQREHGMYGKPANDDAADTHGRSAVSFAPLGRPRDQQVADTGQARQACRARSRRSLTPSGPLGPRVMLSARHSFGQRSSRSKSDRLPRKTDGPLGISEQTYYRWRNQFRRLTAHDVKRVAAVGAGECHA